VAYFNLDCNNDDDDDRHRAYDEIHNLNAEKKANTVDLPTNSIGHLFSVFSKTFSQSDLKSCFI